MWDVSGTDGAARLHRHLEIAQDVGALGSWEADVVRRELRCSARTCEIFGRDPAQPVGFADVLAVVHPDDRAELVAAHEAALADGAPFSTSHRILRPDGAVRHVRHEAVVERDAGGAAVGIAGFVQDVTDRVQVARALADSDAQRRELVHRLVQASELARAQLAADLHDVPIQLLTVAAMRLEHLGIVDPEPPPWLREAIDALRSTMNRLRDVLVELHPAVGTAGGLEGGLTALATRVVPDADIAVEIVGDEPDEETSRVLFGIVQEALWEAPERRDVERLEFRVGAGPDGVALDIVEGGRPLPVGRNQARASALGVIERAEAVGGTCTVDADGDRRAIRCWLPTAPGGPR